ncbi:hypothetical protein [Megamonas funiformis]|uniref:hypothetical protein n=1 Tax=Megamonas funiformis TaxID=437897 RepID=UPI0022E40E38|nr:hypothetical protein [Megamonas funiformis]
MRKIEISYYQGKTFLDIAKKFFSNPEVQADFERWIEDGRCDGLMKEIEKSEKEKHHEQAHSA